jgi:hypothetical protein
MVVNGQSKELIRLLNRVVANTKAAADSRSTWDAIEIKALVEMMLPLWAIVGVQPGLLIGDETILEPLVGNRITIVLPRRQGFPEGPSCWLKLVDPDTRSLRYLLLNAGKKDSEDALAKDVSQLMHIADAWTQWIENHANENNDDRILPGDGLQCGDTVFVWGGKPYTSITTTIAPLLRVLEKAYQHRRDATLPEFEAALGVRILDGFGRCFDVGKYPNKRKHEVWETIVGKRGKYRLIDPAEAK